MDTQRRGEVPARGPDPHQFPEVQNRRLSGCFWVSGRRPITRPWRNLAQATGPQLVAAKVLIVNYTFGTGTEYTYSMSASRLFPRTVWTA